MQNLIKSLRKMLGDNKGNWYLYMVLSKMTKC